jgi:hypothetical protein
MIIIWGAVPYHNSDWGSSGYPFVLKAPLLLKKDYRNKVFEGHWRPQKRLFFGDELSQRVPRHSV